MDVFVRAIDSDSSVADDRRLSAVRSPSIEIISVRWTVQTVNRICIPRGKREDGLTARYDKTVQQS